MPTDARPAERWPNFFIVGAPRAATTSLYYYLREVPGVYLPPVKDLDYFAVTRRSRTDPRHAEPHLVPFRDKDRYLELFRGAGDAGAVGEVSAFYLRDPEAARLIHEVAPGARIIMCLRDPVERAFSNYLMHVRDGVERRPFADVFESSPYINPGLYAAQVARYLDTFGPRQVKILIFEEFIRDTRAAVNDILEFLGVDYRVENKIVRRHNTFAAQRAGWLFRIVRNRAVRAALETFVPWRLRRFGREKVLFRRAEKPRMPESCRKRLEEMFRDDVKALEALLGRALPWTLGGKR